MAGKAVAPSNRVSMPTLELLGNESRMNICVKKKKVVVGGERGGGECETFENKRLLFETSDIVRRIAETYSTVSQRTLQ